MKVSPIIIVTFSLFTLSGMNFVRGQYCDSLVPSFVVDLSAKADSTWYSPMLYRSGNCCGTISPDVCVSFDVTISPNASAVIVNIYAGALLGATFVNFECSGLTPLGDTIFFPGNGPFTLTYCKPGNNLYGYSIQSIPDSLLDLHEYNKTYLNIYPNPADDFLFVESNERINSYCISDISGKIFLTGKLTDDGKIEISKVPPGIYFIEFISENEKIRKKIILN